ncbi:pre-mRNA-splicing factor Cwc22p [[Candida] anglica]|uniref:Pre-mRNA-splicing factor CWC22 n=1 Tax=[Candida] anglica TaxID=148631 RepID=A0ABP0EMA8_9ASCO
MNISNDEYLRTLKLRARGEENHVIESTNQTELQRQRSSWKSIKQTIDDLLYSCNPASDVKDIVKKLFEINLLRAKGLLIRSMMKIQSKNITRLSPIFASIISVVNSKIPDIGELLINRLILQFKRAYRKNNIQFCMASIIFICHLVNQKVNSEILLLQILQMLLTKPTSGTLKLSVTILSHSGKALDETSPVANNMIFEKLRNLLHEGNLSRPTELNIERLFKIRKFQFKDFPIIMEGYDLVEAEDQITHNILFDEEDLKSQDRLNVFKFDEDYEKLEQEYKELKDEILGNEEDEIKQDEIEESEENDNKLKISDMTDSELQNFQKTVYLTVMSSMSSDEAVHKLMKLSTQRKSKDNDITLVDMIVKCCSQEKTYTKYYGVIGERLCYQNEKWHQAFIINFKNYYEKIHQFEANSLRNIAKFWGHMFASDRLAIDKSWNEIQLTEEETNAASRIFIKFMFQEMVEELGIKELKERVTEDFIKPSIRGIFPVIDTKWDDADNLRFSINFFTAIGLGVLTEEMRDVLKNLPPEERGRSRSRSRNDSRSGSSRSFSRSRSSSYSRSRSRSYSRSRSRSYSRSRSRSRSYSRSRSRSYSRSRSVSRDRSTSPNQSEPISRSPSNNRSINPKLSRSESKSPSRDSKKRKVVS